MGMSDTEAGEALAAGPGWFVIKHPYQDPAHVVRGPVDADSAESHARFLTARARIMHTPALANAVVNDGYNVVWHDGVEKPDAVREGDGDE